MLRRGLKTAYRHSLMHTVHYLKDADQCQSHNLVWYRFVCTICVVEIGVDGSIVVSATAEQVARWDSVVAEMFAPHTDYHKCTLAIVSAHL